MLINVCKCYFSRQYYLFHLTVCNLGDFLKLKQAYNKFFPRLVAITLPMVPGGLMLDGEPQNQFGRSLLFFYELHEFVERLKAILGNLLCQLEAVYADDNKTNIYPSFANVHFESAILYLANCFCIFVNLEDIIRRNLTISQAISLFKGISSCFQWLV